MNGRELSTRLTKMRPNLKALYVSGYADGIVRNDAHGAVEEGLAFLEKPYPRRAQQAGLLKAIIATASPRAFLAGLTLPNKTILPQPSPGEEARCERTSSDGGVGLRRNLGRGRRFGLAEFVGKFR